MKALLRHFATMSSSEFTGYFNCHVEGLYSILLCPGVRFYYATAQHRMYDRDAVYTAHKTSDDNYKVLPGVTNWKKDRVANLLKIGTWRIVE